MHMKSAHEEGLAPLEFFCDQCGKGFSRNSDLKRHIGAQNCEANKTKSKERCLYPCNQCQRQFHSAVGLANHKSRLICDPDKVTFPCSQCDNRYTTEKAAQKHELTHFHGKPYKCERCGEGFTEK